MLSWYHQLISVVRWRDINRRPRYHSFKSVLIRFIDTLRFQGQILRPLILLHLAMDPHLHHNCRLHGRHLHSRQFDRLQQMDQRFDTED